MIKSTLTFLAFFAVAEASHFYVLRNQTGPTCLIVDGDFQFDLVFQVENETKKYTAYLNETFEFTGDCQSGFNNQSTQTLNVKFRTGAQSARYAKEWELEIIFTETSNEAFKILNYTLKTQKTDDIPYFGTFVNDQKTPGDVTATGLNAYKCSTAKLALDGGSSINIKGANIIAFAHINSTTFPADQGYEMCYSDVRTSDVVPIVVGACLAALVVIVLVSYLIGRARAKRQGYASV